MKTISKEQLTAYALNELSPNEQTELTSLLAEAPGDATYAEETREFCHLLQQNLGHQETTGLSEEQKAVIAKTVLLHRLPPRGLRHRWPLILGGSAAAALAVWLTTPYFRGPTTKGIVAIPAASEAEKNSNSTWADPVQTHLKAARGYFDLGQYDQAKLAINEALAIEPDNLVAHQFLEKTEQETTRYLADANHHSRSRSMRLVDELWETSVPKTASESAPLTVASPAGAKAALGVAVDTNASAASYDLADGERGATPLSPSTQPNNFGLARFGQPQSLEEKARGYARYSLQLESEARATPESLATVNAQMGFAESYIAPAENPYHTVAAEPLSTFSIDVDTASYANVRRFLNMGQRPPAEAVRLEELVNYFRYDYPAPAEGKPCSITADLVSCPWNEHHRLARVGLKAKTDEHRPNANLVFLLDVSGSMDQPNKLPLVKQSLHLLVDKLTENDRVSIVVYAGASGLVLPPTQGANKHAILGAIDNLQPGGSTNGASGITLAYEEARKAFLKEGVNRVILATDGDFNVGVSDRDGLQSLIEKEAKSGVFLSVLGYGMGNLKDATMETLADKGNGNYAYIDSLGEARKVLSEEMSSTLVTVAKDVKVQIEFNPSLVRSYRLLGYENRMLAKEDFNNDKKDAGEMGAGHTVTALYEIVPTDAPLEVPVVDQLKYQAPPVTAPAAEPRPASNETMTVKIRYKAPDAEVSQLMELPVTDQKTLMANASGDCKFATAVASYAMLLKGSDQGGALTWETVRQLAKAGKGADAEGYRGEFMALVDKAEGLAK